MDWTTRPSEKKRPPAEAGGKAFGAISRQTLLKAMPRETNAVAAKPAVVTLRLIALPTIAVFASFFMEVALFLLHPTPDAQYK
jgi:hypothetical protein